MQRCRGCDEEVQLSAAVHLYSPRLSVFVKQMELITCLILPNLPELPAYICNSCKQKLTEATAFRALCIRTQEKYDQLPTAKLPAVDSLDPLSIIESEKNVSDVKIEIKEEHNTTRDSCDENDFSEISFDNANDNEHMECFEDDCEDQDNDGKSCEDETWQEHMELVFDKTGSDGSIEHHLSEETKQRNKNKKCKPSEELTVCDQCGKSLQRKNLELHLLRHTGVKNFQCTLCKAKFYSDYLLELHTRKRHKSREELEAENATRQLYKALTKESNVRTKRQTSTDIETGMSESNEQQEAQVPHEEHANNANKKKKIRHNCEQCDKSFKIRRDLQLHMLRHSGVKDFECEHCQARFYTLHLLKMHARKHTEPFKCRYCDETFGYNNSRNRHERLHTNERPFECKYCDKRFVCATSLKDHQVKHTGELNYHCTICDIRFSMNKQLHSHTRSKAHKEALLKLKKDLDEGNRTGEA